MLWAQAVRGFNPTHAALLLFPMAVMSILLAKPSASSPTGCTRDSSSGSASRSAWSACCSSPGASRPTRAIWQICVFQVLVGIGNACIWAPTAATATRNLPMQLAGAGSGVYNATRQFGAVIGSAAIAVLMDSMLAHYLPGRRRRATRAPTRSPTQRRRPVLAGHAARRCCCPR